MSEPLYENLAPGIEFAHRYALLRVLGQGGFGKVFLADDLTLEIRVALKVLNPALAHDEKQIKRFRREVVVARKISHRNVCKLYDIGQVGNIAYLTMEFIDGRDLYGMLAKHRAFPLRTGLDICHQISSALEAAHREGVVHRDLKPHNVIIDRDGIAKILDFGIARSMDLEGVTATGMMMGTPTYMSPEQARGEAGDPRSDLYSFGVLMYQLFTGAAPFTAETPLGVLFQHVQAAAKSPALLNPSIPPDIDALILKCLAKELISRYQSAQEICDEIALFFKAQGWTLGLQPADREALFGEPSQVPIRGQSPPKQGRSPLGPERVQTPPPSPRVPTPKPPVPAEPTASTLMVDGATPARRETPSSLPARRQTPAVPLDAPTLETPGRPTPARPETTPLGHTTPLGQTTPIGQSRPMDQTTPIGASSPLDRTTPVGQTPKPAPRLVTPPAPQPAPLLQPTDSEELDALEPTDIVVSPQPALPAAAVQHSTQAIEIEEPAQTSRGLLVALVLVSISLGIAAAFVGPKIWAQLNRGKGTPRTSATALIAQIPQAEVATPTSVPPTMIPPTSTQVVALAVPPTPDSQEVPLNPTEIPSPTEIPTLPATETPVPTEVSTQTPEPSPTPEPPTPVPTETPLPTEPPKAVQEPTKKPTKTPAPAQPTQAPTPKPTKAAPTVPPTPKPAKPSPTQPAVAAVVDNIIIGGLPADAEVCVDGVASKATKQGLSFILNGIQAGSRKLGFTSKQKGSAQKNVEILGDGQRNAPIKLQPADWKAPRYRVVLQAGAEKVELEKPVDGHDEIKLKSGETITVSLSLQDTKLTIRRADGREHEKFCPWQERASCGPLPVLSCGTVPVPQ